MYHNLQDHCILLLITNRNIIQICVWVYNNIMVCQIPTQVREDANNWRKKLKNVCINIFIIFKKIHDVQCHCTLYNVQQLMEDIII